jgi:ABC-2 type transport system permease protein
VFPLKEYGGAQDVLVYLPTAALADGLRALLQHGHFVVRDALVLLGWAVAGLTAAARWFRWE